MDEHVAPAPGPTEPDGEAGAEIRAEAPRATKPRRGPALGVIALLLGVSGATAPFAFRRGIPGTSFSTPWWLLLAMFALAEVFVLQVQVQREAKTISLSEIPLVLGLFSASLPGLLVARVVGPTLAFVFHRRQRNPIKLAFNITLVMADLCAALAVFGLVLADAPATGLRGWAATYAAVAVFGLIDAASLSLVIGLYEGQVRGREIVRDGASAIAMSACVGTLGLVAVTSLQEDPHAGWLLAAAGLVLTAAYRFYARLSERHVSLEQLYRFSQVVSSTPEVDAVLSSVLEQAKELLRAEHAEVVLLLSPDRSSGVSASVGPSGRLERRDVRMGTADWLWAKAVDGDRPVLARRHGNDPAVRLYLEHHRHREAAIVPLRRDGLVVGTIAVADRMGDVRTFDHSDLRLLEMVANHAAVALQNGRLIDQLRHEALHDALTGLPNRTLLTERMTAAMARLAQGESPGFAAMIMDLDGFKDINDTLGHQHGDELLVEVGERLQDSAGRDATVARLGGDEFALLLPDTADTEAVMRIGVRLLHALHRPFVLDGVSVPVSGSIGVSLSPLHGEDVSTIMKRADVAMYAAKQTNGGLRLYEPTMDSHSPERLALLAELRHAVEHDQLEIHVQPKVDLRDGSLTGVEALARWEHSQQGEVSPTEFIPVAERSGLIRPLTLSVLRSALAACARWRALGHEIGVAVNLSARNLLDDELVDDVRGLLRQHGVPARLLTLEITESSVMTDPEQAMSILRQLRAMGVRLSLDDFGTGYSSLSYLNRLPVDEVKIDRSFVTDMCRNPDEATIVRSIVDLGSSLDLDIVAEGVEDSDTRDALALMGCDSAQGFLLSKPLPVDEFLPWLAQYSHRRDALYGRPGAALAASG